MKKQKIKKLINKAIIESRIVNLHSRLEVHYYNAIPLAANDKLFLVVNEDDFIFDGFSVYRFKDLKKVKIKNDLCDKILRNEGILATLETPFVDISSWLTVFRDLKEAGENIIVEKQSLNEDECEFVIGRIERIRKKFCYVRHFDAEGVWRKHLYKIPYSEITKVTFASRYVTIFSKYIGSYCI